MAYADASYGSLLPLGPYSYGFAKLNGTSLADVNEALLSMHLAVTVANPTDSIVFNIRVYDENYNLLFYGFRTFGVTPGKSLVSKESGSVKLKLVDNVPIPLPGALSAIIETKDSLNHSDSPIRLPFDDYSHTMYFNQYYAGENAILSVQYPVPVEKGEGDRVQSTYWSTKDGEEIIPGTTPSSVSVEFENVLHFIDQNVSGGVETTNHIGRTVSADLKLTKERVVQIGFLAADYTNAKPDPMVGFLPSEYTDMLGVRIYGLPGGPVEIRDLKDMARILVEVNLPAGSYQIVPIWPEGKVIEPPMVPPPVPDNMGKG